MDCDKRSFFWAETAAILYLAVPLFIFLAFFVRVAIAIPACAFTAFLLFELVRRTSWRGFLTFRWWSVYYFALAVVWMWLAGGIGLFALTQNEDWSKHNLIINLLAEHSWPLTIDLPHFGPLVLRYYIGWHLVPSLLVRITHLSSMVAASLWNIVGIFLFFSLLPDLVGKRGAIVAAPLVFIFFGGADIIGTLLAHYPVTLSRHYEWWAGWAQYSSNTTAIFWTPQQALPAWLGVALLMRCRNQDALLPYCALVASSALLWSPFATIGLAPFLLVLAVKRGVHSIILAPRPILSTLLLAVPIALYLSSGVGTLPHGFIWNQPCSEQYSCFTWPSYPLFLIIEVGAPLLLLLIRREPEQGFLVAAAGALCLIPLYRMGVDNDFAMRASLPSLAFLAISCSKPFAAPGRYPGAVIGVLLLAFPGTLGELSRGFGADPLPTIDLVTSDESFRWWIDQTFVKPPIPVLR